MEQALNLSSDRLLNELCGVAPPFCLHKIKIFYRTEHCADIGEFHKQNTVDGCMTPVTTPQRLQSPLLSASCAVHSISDISTATQVLLSTVELLPRSVPQIHFTVHDAFYYSAVYKHPFS